MSELYEDPSERNDPDNRQPGSSVSSTDQTTVIVSNFPDQQSATQAAEQLLESGMVACINIMSACQSVYRWSGKVQTETEIPVWFKTTQSQVQAVSDLISKLHPHDIPEILAIKPDSVLPAYNAWVQREVNPK